MIVIMPRALLLSMEVLIMQSEQNMYAFLQ